MCTPTGIHTKLVLPPAESLCVYLPPDMSSARPFLSLKLLLHPLRSGPPSNTWFLGPMRVHIQNSISIASAIFAQLTIVTDRQTDRPHYSVHSNRPHLANAAMGPKTDMTAVTPRVVNRQIETRWPSVPKNARIQVTIQYKDSHATRDQKNCGK